jgi:hypothetical protein
MAISSAFFFRFPLASAEDDASVRVWYEAARLS